MNENLIPPEPDGDRCNNCGSYDFTEMKTDDGEYGCTECIAQCRWCMKHFYRGDMNEDRVCFICKEAEEYKRNQS